jgi:hypothetical protein
LEDPLVNLAVYAETRGFISFNDFEYVPQQFLSLRIRLLAAKHALEASVLAVDVIRLAAELNTPGRDKATMSELLKDTVKKYEAELKPSLKKSDANATVDLIARWYLTYAPEVLRAAGVELPTTT